MPSAVKTTNFTIRAFFGEVFHYFFFQDITEWVSKYLIIKENRQVSRIDDLTRHCNFTLLLWHPLFNSGGYTDRTVPNLQIDPVTSQLACLTDTYLDFVFHSTGPAFNKPAPGWISTSFSWVDHPVALSALACSCQEPFFPKVMNNYIKVNSPK